MCNEEAKAMLLQVHYRGEGACSDPDDVCWGCALRLAEDVVQVVEAECNKYGITQGYPCGTTAGRTESLFRHIYNNHAATLGAKDSLIKRLQKERKAGGIS